MKGQRLLSAWYHELSRALVVLLLCGIFIFGAPPPALLIVQDLCVRMIALVAIILACLTLTSCSNITVIPSSSCNQPCGSAVNGTTIDQALGGISSGDYLQIQPGCHCVQKFNVVGNVSDISLIGNGAGVQITCAPGLGLAFLNVTRLTLQGLTITGCGLNGSNAIALNNAINALVDLFIQLTREFNVAVVIAGCTDVVADHVTIVNTTGLGLVGVNVAGQSNFTNDVFSFNTDLHCVMFNPLNILGKAAGGGAQFIYVDYLNQSTSGPVALNIDNNTFSYNSYCGSEIIFQLYRNVFDTLGNRSYAVGSGVGLSLSFAQQGYSVQISVQRSTFEKNVGTYGGGTNVIWYATSFDTQIIFSDCTFTENGFPFSAGSGIALFKDIPIASTRPRSEASKPHANTMSILRTNFIQNTAGVGGGIYVLSFYSKLSTSIDQFTVERCRFEANSGAAGAAVFLTETKGHGTQRGLTATVRDCMFVSNRVAQQADTPSSSVGILQALAMNVTVQDTSFSSNYGTAIGGTRSLLIFAGEVNFYNNSGLTGGALHLSAATLVLMKDNSRATFVNNSATISGAAVYTDYGFGESDINSYFDCFLYFGSLNLFCTQDYPCPNLTAINISLVFSNNKAPLGATLYGSTLDVCPWAIQLKELLNADTNSRILQLMYERRIILQMDRSPNTSAIFSSPVSTLELSNTSAFSSYMPGQQFVLAIRSADRLNQSIQTVLTSQTFDNFFPMLGDSGYWLTTTTDNLNATTRVYGQRNVTMNVTLYSIDTFVPSNSIPITLTECLFGFEYIETVQGGDCRCNNATTSSMVTCDGDLKLFNVTRGWWVGPDRVGGTGLVYKPCPSDYCVIQNGFVNFVTVTPQALDKQCAYNRTGLLCGRCQDGYSAVFGTNKCMKCTDNTLGLLVFFAAAGIGIIAFISFLHITISDGYINGVLFYVSIVSSYEVHFVGHLKGREVFIPIFFLNLDMGFETCFYDGMTQLDRAGLSLVFPIYLFILMVLFIFLASRSLRLSEYLAKSNFTPSKLIATLITLSYNSITQSCFQILASIQLTVYRDDGSSYVIFPWATDPNVQYFSPLHTVLFIIAIILVAVFVIPVPILLIIPTFTSRFVWRLKPLYDAFVSPLKDRFTFWIGLRFILRIVYFTISSFSEPPLNIFLLAVGLVLAFLLNTSVQPYKSSAINTIDNFFQCNILILAVGALYFQEATDGVETGNAELAFAILVLGTAYLVTLLILGKQIFLRFPWLSGKLKATWKKLRNGKQVTTNPATHSVVGETKNHRDVEMAETNVAVPKFAQLREPLLDGAGLD